MLLLAWRIKGTQAALLVVLTMVGQSGFAVQSLFSAIRSKDSMPGI